MSAEDDSIKRMQLWLLQPVKAASVRPAKLAHHRLGVCKTSGAGTLQVMDVRSAHSARPQAESR